MHSSPTHGAHSVSQITNAPSGLPSLAGCTDQKRGSLQAEGSVGCRTVAVMRIDKNELGFASQPLRGATSTGRRLAMIEKLVRGQIAGVAATVAMTIVMLVIQLSGLNPMGEFLPMEVLTRLYDSEGPAIRLLAVVGHALYGVLWGMIFVVSVPRGRIGAGLAFGLLPWLVLVLHLMPIFRSGFLASREKPAIAAATLLMHLIYGGALGAANSFIFRRWTIECRARPAQASAPSASPTR